MICRKIFFQTCLSSDSVCHIGKPGLWSWSEFRLSEIVSPCIAGDIWFLFHFIHFISLKPVAHECNSLFFFLSRFICAVIGSHFPAVGTKRSRLLHCVIRLHWHLQLAGHQTHLLSGHTIQPPSSFLGHAEKEGVSESFPVNIRFQRNNPPDTSA